MGKGLKGLVNVGARLLGQGVARKRGEMGMGLTGLAKVGTVLFGARRGNYGAREWDMEGTGQMEYGM